MTFQSTLPQGERRFPFSYLITPYPISIHAPTRGATQPSDCVRGVTMISIHAPTRGATDHCMYTGWYGVISIHAPTRGATLLSATASVIIHISIHAPTRGATTHKSRKTNAVLKFQSTLPQGERPIQVDCLICRIQISIHAPTRGATQAGVAYYNMQVISIHAPTRGATTITAFHTNFTKFQSTLPQGERRIRNRDVYCFISISIHAPTRGATNTIT